VTGFLRPIGDVLGMSRDALSILADPENKRRFSEAARRRAIEEFPEERAVAQYLDVYERALSG
jgi:glycosyltransferase involved in cell wall biosynthesis